ncbi:MAG: nucleotidyltransferase family protein [Chloroflexi bacterium]|nr:nucleotidyltransferase family protein [Chloroflexota bacterium]
MMSLSQDTAPEIEALQLELQRRMAPWRKMALLGDMHASLATLALAGLRQLHPAEPLQTLERRLADALLGAEIAKQAYGSVGAEGRAQEMATSFTEVVLRVTGILEGLGIAYAIGGSVASAIHGVVRSTLDIDIVADLQRGREGELLGALGEEFYADGESIREAVAQRRFFNLIHLSSSVKVDIFVARPRAFDRAQLSRRQRIPLADSPEQSAYVISAEDIALAKLDWYRLGEQVSDRQWRDVLGVIKAQGEALDLDYLRRMAHEMGLADLLERALAM